MPPCDVSVRVREGDKDAVSILVLVDAALRRDAMII